MTIEDVDPGLAKSHGTWVQTDRAAHEIWSQFLALNGAAAASRVLHILIARMADRNAVVISQNAIAELMGVDPRTVRRAIAMLREYNWIETVNLGGAKSGVQAYVVNSRVAWHGPRGGIRHSVFDAKIYAAESEQDATIGINQPLHQIPSLLPGERQLPTGNGLPPVSQPSLGGLEPDIPARALSADDYSDPPKLIPVSSS